MKLSERQTEKLTQAMMVLYDCSDNAPDGMQSKRFEKLADSLSQIIDDYA